MIRVTRGIKKNIRRDGSTTCTCSWNSRHGPGHKERRPLRRVSLLLIPLLLQYAGLSQEGDRVESLSSGKQSKCKVDAELATYLPVLLLLLLLLRYVAKCGNLMGGDL